jgi:hypothetical protein
MKRAEALLELLGVVDAPPLAEATAEVLPVRVPIVSAGGNDPEHALRPALHRVSFVGKFREQALPRPTAEVKIHHAKNGRRNHIPKRRCPSRQVHGSTRSPTLFDAGTYRSLRAGAQGPGVDRYE